MSKNILLEKKCQRKPLACIHILKACVCRHELAHTSQVGFQKHKKGKFSALILRFGTNPILFESHFKPQFSQYK